MRSTRAFRLNLGYLENITHVPSFYQNVESISYCDRLFRDISPCVEKGKHRIAFSVYSVFEYSDITGYVPIKKNVPFVP